jgi:hypothetical protein
MISLQLSRACPELEALPAMELLERGWPTLEPFIRILARNIFHVIDANVALG